MKICSNWECSVKFKSSTVVVNILKLPVRVHASRRPESKRPGVQRPSVQSASVQAMRPEFSFSSMPFYNMLTILTDFHISN